LEEVRSRLGPNLDSLSHEKDKDELRAIVAALRRGELRGLQHMMDELPIPETPKKRSLGGFKS